MAIMSELAAAVDTEKQVHTIAGPYGNLFAIHEPPLESTSVCIIMLSAGFASREGSRRLYWRASRSLRNGSGVLRVDLGGVGDSEAETDARHFDVHRVEEVYCAIDYAKSQLGYRRVVLLGLCAGARVALKAAGNRPDVNAIIAWSMPVLTAGGNFPRSPLEPAVRSSSVTSKADIKRVLHFMLVLRFLHPSWWRLRLASNTNESLFSIVKNFRNAVIYKIRGEGGATEENVFVSCVKRYLEKNRNILFVYGELDATPLAEFESIFTGMATEGSRQSYHVVGRGQHVFPTLASQKEVIGVTSRWIDKHTR
ncbi:hypothetical protein AB833_24855 [Chromatiales bacterium (ex Bugula neritina AB1)]|nr:hypothetical protein AB833_24855 [Chromatiales bacterium (ex Bugula neritina AB1)]